MKLATLNQRNPAIDLDRLADLHALYEGGEAFDRRKESFLPQRPDEPAEVYAYRLKVAEYLNYCGPIVDYFAAALFSARLDLRVRGSASKPEWLAAFKEDCDRAGTDLIDFFRAVFTLAAVKRRAWVLVDFPRTPDEPATRAEWLDRGLDRAYLCALEPEAVLDWGCDEAGALEWAIVHHIDTRRTSPAASRDEVVESWTIYTREGWERYAITRKRNESPAADLEVPVVASGRSATPGRVPLVCLEVPVGLWVMNRIASPQLSNARTRNALAYSLARTAYATRVFHMHEVPGEKPVFGPGYGLVLGVDEKISHATPPAEAFAPLAAFAEDTKQELYRVTNQLAQGVNNNAAAIGRSGESKQADGAATEVVLRAFGAVACEAIEAVLDLVSLGRGEAAKWDVSGLNAFNVADLASLLEAAMSATTLDIRSRTFRVRLKQRVALQLLPDANQEDRDAIFREIEDGEADEAEADPASTRPPADDEAEETEPNSTVDTKTAHGFGAEADEADEADDAAGG